MQVRPLPAPVQAALLATLLSASISYGLGVGAVPYTLLCELFPPHYKTVGACLAQLTR